MSEIRVTGPEQLIPISEWTRGARHSRGDIAVVSLREGNLGLQAHVQSADVPAETTWREHVLTELDRIEAKMHQYGYDHIIIAGWGGGEIESVLQEHTTGRLAEPQGEDQPDLIGTYRVEHGQLYAQPSAAGAQGRWTHSGPVPEVNEVEMAICGLHPPAETAEARVASLRPVPGHAAPAIGEDVAEVVTNVPPSARVGMAVTALDELTAQRMDPQGVRDEYRVSNIQVVAAAVSSSKLVRDAVGTEAAASPQRVSSLIEAYLEAPEEQLEAMSSCAAGANHFSGGSSQATTVLAEQALASQNEWAPAASMAVTHAQVGESGSALHPGVAEQVSHDLDAADTAFTRAADQRWLAERMAMTTPDAAIPGLEVN